MTRASILFAVLLQATAAAGAVPTPAGSLPVASTPAASPVAARPVRAADRPAPLVKRGDAIVIAVRSGALTITAHGKALSDGAMGDRVRVINDATRRTLQAVVDGPARVKILTE
jgi:flagella basal body P-ring formation protein FlgA